MAGPYVDGEPVAQGERTDLGEICTFIKGGASDRDVALAHPEDFVRFHKGFTALRMTLLAHRDTPPELHVWIGPTGIGKSRWAFENWPCAYWKPASRWWDGYMGQTAVILDEYPWPAAAMSYVELLRFTDRYPMMVEYKGGSCALCATVFVITSNVPIEDWFQADLAPLRRRITYLRDSFKELSAVTVAGLTAPPLQ